MASKKYSNDIQAVLSQRHNNGADYWATPDGRVGVGAPFSTLTSLIILHELGLGPRHEAVKGASQALFAGWREEGRFRVTPGGIYPCHTSNAARVLSRFGHAKDSRLQITYRHLLETRHEDGGWRCNKFSYGRGPETELSNPGVTLFALDALRFTKQLDQAPLNNAVESLLNHWTVKQPTGPCQFGIGTLFKQTEYPFIRYNLFYYVYVLSFYAMAKPDKRFQEAFELLASKRDEKGQMIVERPHRGLADFECCRKGEPSPLASKRFREIEDNLALV